MGYELTALLAPASVPLAPLVPGVRVVRLSQGTSLAPLPDDLIDTITGGGDAEWEGGFRALPRVLADRIARASAAGPIAYVEAEYFGGTGTQDARVWRDGAVLLDRHEASGRARTPSPISEALRLLGVRAAGGDEFDSVGLGRCRRTGDWLDEPIA